MLLIVYFDVFRNDLIKRLKENNIQFDIFKYDQINLDKKYDTVIITGAKKRILREHNFPLLDALLSRPNLKIIGICFGFQYLAFKSGATIREDKLFKGLIPMASTGEYLHFNHHDKIIDLSKKWTIIARLDDFINIAATENFIGFQFHPEKNPAHFRHYILPFIVS
jgi:GMP synthase-like glutamine amidotransferase